MGVRIRTRVVVVLLAMVFLIALPGSAWAMTVRQGNAVTIGSGETIDDDLYVFGSNVRIDGTVNGDVIAFGQVVDVSGPVKGDVVAGGQTVRVSSSVGGSVRAGGQDVSVTGATTKDVVAGGSTVDLSGKVGRDVAAGGNQVRIAAPVTRDALVGAETLIVSAAVGRNVTAEVTRLQLASGGSIGGNLDYTSANQAEIQGTVTGRTVRSEPPARRTTAPSAGGAFLGGLFGIVAWVQGFVALAVFGLIMALLAPRSYRETAMALLERPWPSLGVGLLLFIVVPAVGLFVFGLGLFVGVWWLAFMLGALYWIGLTAGYMITSLALGRLILRGPVSRGLHDVWAMLLGLAIVWVLTAVPILGGLVGALTTVFGLGALALVGTAHWRTAHPPTVQPTAVAPSQTPMQPA